jgi:hypothetical protein
MIETDVVLQAVSRGNLDMKRSVVAALGAALVAVALGASSAAQAAAINFIVDAIDGSPDYTGTSLDQSSALDVDNAFLVVSEVGAGDDSGLSAGDLVSISAATFPSSNIIYGSGDKPSDFPTPLGADVTLKWPVPGPGADTFTETLTTVKSIDRGTPNQITVTLSGTLSDTSNFFVDTPVLFTLNANQDGGPGSGNPTGVMFTNSTTTIAVIPEASTWSMMALGFATLGYAVSRRRRAKAAILSA